MGANIDVFGIPFDRCAIAGFGLFEFALVKVNVPELIMMVRLVEVVNLGLKFLDPAPVVRAG